MFCVSVQGSPFNIAILCGIFILAIFYKSVEFCSFPCEKRREKTNNGKGDGSPFEKAEQGQSEECFAVYADNTIKASDTPCVSSSVRELRSLPQVDCVHEHDSRRAHRFVVVGLWKDHTCGAKEVSRGSRRSRRVPFLLSRTRSLEEGLHSLPYDPRDNGDTESCTRHRNQRTLRGEDELLNARWDKRVGNK